MMSSSDIVTLVLTVTATLCNSLPSCVISPNLNLTTIVKLNFKYQHSLFRVSQKRILGLLYIIMSLLMISLCRWLSIVTRSDNIVMVITRTHSHHGKIDRTCMSLSSLVASVKLHDSGNVTALI